MTYVIRNQLTGKTGKAHVNDLYLANLDLPWDKVRLEYKPIDKTEDPDLLDPVLQPTRTQPMRTCKLAVRDNLITNKAVVQTEHNEKSNKSEETRDHGITTRSTLNLERKCKSSLSPSRTQDGKRVKLDDDMDTDEVNMLYDSPNMSKKLVDTCISMIGSSFSKLFNLLADMNG